MVHELGTVGMVCPFPLINEQMDELQAGEQLKIDFDWYTTTEDYQIGQRTTVIP